MASRWPALTTRCGICRPTRTTGRRRRQADRPIVGDRSRSASQSVHSHRYQTDCFSVPPTVCVYAAASWIGANAKYIYILIYHRIWPANVFDYRAAHWRIAYSPTPRTSGLGYCMGRRTSGLGYCTGRRARKRGTHQERIVPNASAAGAILVSTKRATEYDYYNHVRAVAVSCLCGHCRIKQNSVHSCFYCNWHST